MCREKPEDNLQKLAVVFHSGDLTQITTLSKYLYLGAISVALLCGFCLHLQSAGITAKSTTAVSPGSGVQTQGLMHARQAPNRLSSVSSLRLALKRVFPKRPSFSGQGRQICRLLFVSRKYKA